MIFSGLALGWCVAVARGVTAFFYWSLISESSAIVVGIFFQIRFGCRRYGKLQSFLSDAIAPEPFLREVPLTPSMSRSAVQRQTRIYQVRIPHRKGHSIHRVVLAGFDHLWWKPLHPRSATSRPKREGSQAVPWTTRIEQPAESSFVNVSLLLLRVLR
jgi:hypothetical protein